MLFENHCKLNYLSLPVFFVFPSYIFTINIYNLYKDIRTELIIVGLVTELIDDRECGQPALYTRL